MITECPNCQTRFRVTPEELAIRHGLVRCGRCATVFNGFATLERSETTESLNSIQPSASTGLASLYGLSGHIEGALPEPRWTPVDDSAGGAVTSGDDVSHVTPDGMNAPSLAPHTEQEQADLDAGETPIAATSPETTATSATERAVNEESNAQFATDTEELPQPSHAESPSESVEQPEATLFHPDPHQRPHPRRAAWIVASLLLLTSLIGQTTYLLRTEIATRWPETKPYLADLCASFGCDVPLPKRIEEITIESSSMEADPVRQNVVLVTAILRNRGVTSLEYPMLEVTFLDSLEHPIARRSLTAEQYLSATIKKDEGFAPNSEAIGRMAIEVTDVKPAGYRLQLYYR